MFGGRIQQFIKFGLQLSPWLWNEKKEERFDWGNYNRIWSSVLEHRQLGGSPSTGNLKGHGHSFSNPYLHSKSDSVGKEFWKPFLVLKSRPRVEIDCHIFQVAYFPLGAVAYMTSSSLQLSHRKPSHFLWNISPETLKGLGDFENRKQS